MGSEDRSIEGLSLVLRSSLSPCHAAFSSCIDRRVSQKICSCGKAAPLALTRELLPLESSGGFDASFAP